MNETRNDHVMEMEAAHIPAMAEIFTFGQVLHHEMHKEIFCEPENQGAITSYLKSYLPPKNPFRARRKFATVWTINGGVQAYLLYQLYNTSDVFFGENRWVCYIDDIAVHPDARKQGCASALMSNLLSQQLSGVENCLVSGQVWVGNDASSALFEKFDFTDKAHTFYRYLR